MPLIDTLSNIWGLKWIVRPFVWLWGKLVQSVKHAITSEINTATHNATIVRIYPDFLAWERRIAKARSELERDGPKGQQQVFYPLNIPPLGSTYFEIKAPPSIEEHLERLNSLGNFGSSVSKAMILSGDILTAEPNSPAEVEHQMDQLRKLDGVLRLGLQQLDELRDRELSE